MANKDTWALLESLRAGYLGGAPGTELADYWQSDEHLAAYDESFAARIGWKWDAVLDELKGAGFAPPAGYTLHDFGTGSGIAPRAFFAAFPPVSPVKVRLADRSARAVQFALARLAAVVPEAAGARWEPAQGFEPGPAVLLVSHVLTELTDAARLELIALAAQAHTVIWVEPGTPAASRALLEGREALRARGFKLLSPCPHQHACGMAAAANARHWCHMFAKPPSAASQSAYWAEFKKRLGIDLRALPVSWLVASQDAAAATAVPPAHARVIGRAREYKGYLKAVACDAAGVREEAVQKRAVGKELFKHLTSGAFTAHYPTRA